MEDEGSFKEDEADKMIIDSDEGENMNINEVDRLMQDDSNTRHELTWTRKKLRHTLVNVTRRTWTKMELLHTQSYR